MISATDDETEARRRDLLRQLYPVLCGANSTALSPLDRQLDLASVLAAFALAIVRNELGPAAVVAFLQQQIELWSGRLAETGPPSDETSKQHH